MNTDKGKLVIALMTGAVVGAALGILFAPEKGRKTRKDIKNKVTDTSEELSDWLTSTKENLVKSVHENKNKVEKKIRDSVSAMS